MLTHQTLEREKKLHADRVTSEQALQEAEATHRAACQQARMFGFSEEQIDALGKRPNEPVYLEVRAPFGGEIVERTAVRGALAEAGKPLFTVTDRSKMWAMIQVPEAALARVKVGQTVELRADSLPGKVFTGHLTWIAANVRVARARASSPTRTAAQRQMITTARILTRQAKQRCGAGIGDQRARPYVFVKLGVVVRRAGGATGGGFNGRLEAPRREAAEQIAVSHAFAIKSAMLISRLGAGCADD